MMYEELMERMEKVSGIFTNMSKLIDCTGDFEYDMKCLLQAHRLLLEEYVPFKRGNRVELVAAPKCCSDVTSGWYHRRHFLVPGAVGAVDYAEVLSSGRILYYVIFDDGSWVDHEGKVQPCRGKHNYGFEAKDLRMCGTPRKVYTVSPVGIEGVEFDTRLAAEQFAASCPKALNVRIVETTME